jgi:hypothetical protein
VDVDISPFSLQYTWIGDGQVAEKYASKYGVEAGKRSQLDMGSTVNAKFILAFNRRVTFTSRFKYFTNYAKSLVESENELNMQLNNYFSTRIYIYGRYDDSVPPDRTLNFFQLNQVLSFGFNYKW